MGVTARQTKVGINIATAASWSTAAIATAVGAGDGHYLRDDVQIQHKPQIGKEDVATQTYIGMVQVGNFEAIQAQLPMYLHYHDAWQNVLWALALGTGQTAPTQIGVTTAYNNTFEPATSRSNLWATIVRDKSVYVSEVTGAVLNGFELRVGEMGRMEIDWLFTGNNEVEDSTINTSTQIAALTFPTLGRRFFFKDAVIRVNSQAGGALSASDAIPFTTFKLRVEQPVDVKFVGGQQTCIQPLDNGFPKIAIDLTFARFNSTSQGFFSTMKAGTRYKADIVFTGPAIDATSSYGLKFQFPHLAVMSLVSPLPNVAQGEPKITLEGLGTSAAPTGMTSPAVTAPVRVTTTGTSSTNPFA
jgi:hypothetical protein